MMTKDEIMKVLDAMNYAISPSGTFWVKKHNKAKQILQAALAEPSEADDTSCPTCGEDGGTSCGMPNCGLLIGESDVEPQNEPVAWQLGHRFYTSLKDAEYAWRNDCAFLGTSYVPEPLFTHPASKPSEPKPYCCYCESDNEGIRSTYFDQTCEGCVKRMTHPAKPEPLTEREIWQTYAAGFSAEKAEPFEQIKNNPEWAEIVYMTRCIEAAVWAKFAAVKQDAAIKEKFE